MRQILKKVICIALLYVGCNTIALAQSYRQLHIYDFEGRPQSHSGVIAYTNCTIDFRYQAYRKNGYYQLNFDIRLSMNRDRSWMDKGRITSQEMLSEILKHEQGHYIIAYLEQQELLREVGKTRFAADYQYRAQQIFDHVDAKYKQLNKDYDEDTEHMTNRIQQNSWDAYFKKRLEFMPATNAEG